MAVTLSELTKGTATVHVPTNGEGFFVTYRPGLINEDTIGNMSGKSDEVTAWLCELITDWDIMQSKQKKLPITVEGMRKLPYPVLGAISAAIMRDIQSGESLRGSDAG